MNGTKVELIFQRQDELGEGPSWDAARQQLYWIDILGRRLYLYRPAQPGGGLQIFELPEMPGCVAPRRQGGVILALKNGFATFAPESGELRLLLDPEAGRTDNRFNDGKCDPRGRMLAGTMSLQGREKQGSLYSLSPDGQVLRLLSEVSISNGLAWSPDQRTLYYIDTPTRQVIAYEYDLDSGRLGRGRLAFEIPAAEGYPDGMTADAEGNLWIAMWHGAQVLCWQPERARLLRRIAVPALQVTSCVFGGPQRRDLYITSARQEMTSAELAQYPLSGSLFCLPDLADGCETFAFDG